MTDDDIWRAIRDLRQDIHDLRGHLDITDKSVEALEQQTPQAQRLQYEADLAAADLAESGYAGHHGPRCGCPYCEDYDPEIEEYDPGPECDDHVSAA